MDYEKLLKRGKDKLPEVVETEARFEIPKVKGHIQGNKTMITNFLQIAGTLRREPEHVLKYILKELATPGELKKNGTLILGAKVPAVRINQKINNYTNLFVLCSECKKPDTKISKEENVTFMKCQACGAKKPIKGRA